MSTEPVIFYRYDASPYSRKIDNVLTLKRIPHEKVTVSLILPRPEITDLLGITYRRIPILAIGNDVYCDTSIIVTALERRFPASSGHGTLFPPAKGGGLGAGAGLIKAFAKFYAESTLSRHLVTLLPFDAFTPEFMKDRADLFGTRIDTKALEANVPVSQSVVSSHLFLVEEQLRDSREWLFDTASPSLADISLHFSLAWLRASGVQNVEVLFDPARIPFTIKWFDRLSEAIETEKQNQSSPTKILEGLEAAAKIVSASHESYDAVGFDAIEASRLGVALGDTVQVVPEDTGRNHPTAGKLVALSREEVTLEVRGSQGLVRCHFPRIGFLISKAPLKTAS